MQFRDLSCSFANPTPGIHARRRTGEFLAPGYHLWEEFARPRIAQELGVDRNDVKSEWRS